jgi:hypothetical protein
MALLLTRLPQSSTGRNVYASIEDGQITLSHLELPPPADSLQAVEFDLENTRFIQAGTEYSSPVPGAGLYHGQQFAISRSSYPTPCVAVRVRDLWRGGLVVAYRNPENFILFVVNGDRAYVHEMRNGTLSGQLNSATGHLPRECTLRTAWLEDRLCLFADDCILTSFVPEGVTTGGVGLFVDSNGREPTRFHSMGVAQSGERIANAWSQAFRNSETSRQ